MAPMGLVLLRVFSPSDLLLLLSVLCWGHVVEGQTDRCMASENGAVRLWKSGAASTQFTSGTVQICYNLLWGNICDRPRFGFGKSEADVVCHQLGYTGASKYSSSSPDPAHSAIFNVNCNKTSYLTILQCDHTAVSSPMHDVSCTDPYDISILCYTTRLWGDPFDGMVRLQGGGFVTEGRVEVYCSGQWSTVCGRAFNRTSADVVCRQLGYTESVYYNHLSSIPGTDSQPILSNLLPSSSSDVCLTSCPSCCSTPSSSPSFSSCQHNEDATVACVFNFNSRPSSRPRTEIHTCRMSGGNGDTFALLVGGIVGGVVITACLIFSLCIICYLHTICCSKPSPHHTPTSTKSDSSSKKKEVMYTSTLPPDVIKSLDAPPPYSVITSVDAKLSSKTIKSLSLTSREKPPKYPG